MPSKINSVYQLGETLCAENDEILMNCPTLNYDSKGYIEPNVREDLLKFHPEVVLFCPQIPQNTGTISRLCAAFSSTLHIIEPMAFEITEKAVKRAGLDYWEFVNLFIHKNFKEFKAVKPKRRFIFIETGGTQNPYDFNFLPGDSLIFGAETFGIPRELMNEECTQGNAHILTIPMFNKGVRSINLSNTVSMILYLAISKIHANENSIP